MSDDLRRGFLYGLASMGMTPEDFGNLVLKRAAAGASPVGVAATIQTEKSAFETGSSLANMGDLATAGILGLPLAVGGLGGSLLAKATAPDYNNSVKKMKQADLLRQLRLATRQLNRKGSQPPGVPSEPVQQSAAPVTAPAPGNGQPALLP